MRLGIEMNSCNDKIKQDSGQCYKLSDTADVGE